MARAEQTDEVKSALAQLHFFRGNLLAISVWPLACLGVAVLIWLGLNAQLGAEKSRIVEQARTNASTLAQTNAEHLARTLEQLDSHTRTFAFYWSETRGQIRLERQNDIGIFPTDPEFSAFAFDKSGNVLTSLKPFPKSINVSAKPDFVAHKNAVLAGSRLQFLARAELTKKPAILFSRPLRNSRDAFNGVVYVMVPPRYLAASFETTRLGANDALAILTGTGEVVFAKAGKNITDPASLSNTPAKFVRPSGFLRIAGEGFSDNRARLVAWSSAPSSPFVAVAVLDEEDSMADYAVMQRDYFGMGTGATFILFLVAIAGCVSSSRLLWRRHQAALTAETFRLAIDGANEGFFMARALYGVDRKISDFVIESVNEQGAKMMGYGKDTLLNVRFSQLYAPGKFSGVLKTYQLAMQNGFYEDTFKSEMEGRATWTNRRLVRSGHGIAITLRDITDAKTHEQALGVLATTDSLTGLYNRHWLACWLPDTLEAAAREKQVIAVLYLDLDNFKDINNTLGHDAGDEVLRICAQRIQAVLRPEDRIARIGGDEFVVIVTRIEAESDSGQVAERIIATLDNPIPLASTTLPALRTSVGICLYPKHASNAEELLTRADTAMYAAKEAGRGCTAFYTSALTSHIVQRVALKQSLREAIFHREFVPYFQPRVDALTGALRSMEVLVRWKHPSRGLVAPLDFIPFAEETGLIVEIGRQVLEDACRQINAWRAAGIVAVPLSVNVSAVQFEKSDLVSLISECLERFAIEPAMLELEITESCMMRDTGDVNTKLMALKGLGLKLSIDDFGTGYSSLAQLQSLDLDVLKIDRTFTNKITDGRYGKDFFTTILSMANALKMEVVAEGVETAEELAILQLLGCDEIQGYLVSHPVDADRAKAFLAPGYVFSPFERDKDAAFEGASASHGVEC